MYNLNIKNLGMRMLRDYFTLLAKTSLGNCRTFTDALFYSKLLLNDVHVSHVVFKGYIC